MFYDRPIELMGYCNTELTVHPIMASNTTYPTINKRKIKANRNIRSRKLRQLFRELVYKPKITKTVALQLMRLFTRIIPRNCRRDSPNEVDSLCKVHLQPNNQDIFSYSYFINHIKIRCHLDHDGIL